MIEAFVDYIQFSHLAKENAFRRGAYKPISGFGFYDRGYEHEMGQRTYFGNPNSNKAFTVLSGKTMHNWRIAYGDDTRILERIFGMDGKVTRLDTAVTDYVEDDLVTVDDVVNACERGDVTGALVKHGYKSISGADVGQPLGVQTCYIGDPKKRGKRGIFRAYDKGVELDIGKYLITRLELEERGDNAHMSAKRMVGGASPQQIIASRIQFSDNRINRLFDEKPIDISRGEAFQARDDIAENERRWVWLLNQVAPALRKARAFDNENGLGDDRMLKFLEAALIIDATDR